MAQNTGSATKRCSETFSRHPSAARQGDLNIGRLESHIRLQGTLLDGITIVLSQDGVEGVVSTRRS